MTMSDLRHRLSETNSVFPLVLCLTVISLVVFTGTVTFAGPSRYAVQAQQMLAEDQWAKVIQIENSSPSRAYPATVYATVFEFDGALWMYTDLGTQRLSRSRNAGNQDRENLLPLLRDISKGFKSYAIVSPVAGEGETGTDPASFPKLRNGCLIESIWAFRQRSKAEASIESAEILCYSSFSISEGESVNARGEPDGHCVLVYRTDSGYFFVDPSDLSVVGTFRDDIVWKPATVAEEIELAYGETVIERAFFVPFQR